MELYEQLTRGQQEQPALAIEYLGHASFQVQQQQGARSVVYQQHGAFHEQLIALSMDHPQPFAQVQQLPFSPQEPQCEPNVPHFHVHPFMDNKAHLQQPSFCKW